MGDGRLCQRVTSPCFVSGFGGHECGEHKGLNGDLTIEFLARFGGELGWSFFDQNPGKCFFFSSSFVLSSVGNGFFSEVDDS
jgi:hypothetical protein